MAKKVKPESKEQTLEKLNAEVLKRKEKLMGDLFKTITAENALDDLQALHKKMDDLAVMEDALNRVKGTVGAILLNMARGRK